MLPGPGRNLWGTFTRTEKKVRWFSDECGQKCNLFFISYKEEIGDKVKTVAV